MSGDRKPWGTYEGDKLVSRHKTRVAAERFANGDWRMKVRRIKPGDTYANTRAKADRKKQAERARQLSLAQMDVMIRTMDLRRDPLVALLPALARTMR